MSSRKKKETAKEAAANVLASKRKMREIEFLYNQIYEYRRLIEECYCKIDELENITSIEERLKSSEELIGRRISAREALEVLDTPKAPNNVIKEYVNKYKASSLPKYTSTNRKDISIEYSESSGSSESSEE